MERLRRGIMLKKKEEEEMIKRCPIMCINTDIYTGCCMEDQCVW